MGEVTNLKHTGAGLAFGLAGPATDLQTLSERVENLVRAQVGQSSDVRIDFLSGANEDVTAAALVPTTDNPLKIRATVSQPAHSAIDDFSGDKADADDHL